MCNWLYSIGKMKVFWHWIKNWNFQFTFRFLFKVKTNYERSGFSFDIEATADMTGLWSLRNAVWMHAEKTHIITAESRTIRRVLTVKLKDNNETLKLLTIFRWYFDRFDVQKSWNLLSKCWISTAQYSMKKLFSSFHNIIPQWNFIYIRKI